MSTIRKRLSKIEADLLKLELRTSTGHGNPKYPITIEQWHTIQEARKQKHQSPSLNQDQSQKKLSVKNTSKTSANDYKEEPFFLSAYCKETKSILSIEDFCKKYNQPFENLSSHKFLPYHYKEPSYNIVFKPQLAVNDQLEDFNFDEIIQKYIKPIKQEQYFAKKGNKDFDTLTYTDVHTGMNPDADNNTMYVKDWNKEELMKSADILIQQTLEEQESSVLYVDDLGDLLDGMDGQTTRGGHALPQNMTNEECFDAALEFKLKTLYGLVNNYDRIYFNNMCNDNHSGAFGYFVNEAFKKIAEIQFKDKVKVTNHRKFINHYYVGRICFVISHGKDDKSLKFGFKPVLDFKGAEKIDQYCKQNGIYKNSDLVIFKKGDSHQALFDMCTSDDFYYFNYPAISPSSNWIKNNFKLGRRGFVNESFKGLKNYMKIHFIK
jgi:hypothetical protein